MCRSAIFVLVIASVAHADGKPASYRPRAPSFDAARARLLQPKADGATLNEKLGINRGTWRSQSLAGNQIKRQLPEEQEKALRTLRVESLARAIELDPKHELAPAAEWADVQEHHIFSGRQIENAEEGLKFSVDDPRLNLRATIELEERVRGGLARKLADSLRGQAPSPGKLIEVTRALADKHPVLGSSFKVEQLIADMRKIVPELAHWDFREDEQGRAFRGDRYLTPATQALVSRVGHRAFQGANVMFANHMYSDSLLMVDTLTALGMEPQNARFVATPYPFKDRVKKLLEHRGIKVEASPYSVAETKQKVSTAINELLARANENHGPIVVFDDGGMATEIIAKEHPTELYRFRVIEITKAGERVGKTVLPELFDAGPRDHARLDPRRSDAMKQRYIAVRNIDEKSAADAARRWDGLRGNPFIARLPDTRVESPASHAFGFAYYTYSDTPYKRNVMTPLYTEAVNQSLFDGISRGDGVHQLTPINQRVTIVGGGAMGIASGRELREKGYEVTFVEPDAARAELLRGEKFAVEPLHKALPGRGIVLEMAGIKKTIGLDEVSLLEDGVFLAHGSSKDNPFDMDAIRAFASKKIDWPEHEGQRSASYVFKAAGVTKTIHLPGDGFTISHGGKTQNVPLAKFEPELDRLVNLGVYSLENHPVSYYPMFTAPESAMDPTGTAP